MNWLQIGAFFVYILALLSAGIGCFQWLNPRQNCINRFLYLGETLLLGSIIVIGEMLFLSLVHLYTGFWLWGILLLNFSFLLLPSTRQGWTMFIKKNIDWDLPLVSFFILVLFFLFRNCFFLVDVDSHSSYLYAQKLWLEHATSIFASPALDIRIFVPQFNAVPYALGIALFPGEPLFPQLVVASWTVIVVLLVFGYISYRLGRTCALAAVMLCLFNDHMFYSGANTSCIIDSALVALLFTSAYNFWEASIHKNPFRFLLALIFLAQLIANKYQVLYVFITFFIVGILLPNNLKHFRSIFSNRKWLVGLFLSFVICGFWFLKNYLAMGNPVFPILSGDLGTLGWTKEMAATFDKVSPCPLSFPQVIKFLSYLFVWPGINAAKITGMIIFLFPVLMILALRKKEFDIDSFKEMCFWLGLSVIILVGLCLISFVDPRIYRYPIAVMAVACVFSLKFLLEHCFGLRGAVVSVIILLIALNGFQIMFSHNQYRRPMIQQNAAVLLNRLHMKDLLSIYYPDNIIAQEGAKQNPRMFKSAAWDTGIGGVTSLSAYLLPSRPQVGLWYTTVVRWDSYKNVEALVSDLQHQGIEWIMKVQNGKLIFESDEDYAKRAVKFDRFPKQLYYNYGFPQELVNVKY
jgi:hypothetical protein